MTVNLSPLPLWTLVIAYKSSSAGGNASPIH